MKAPNPYVRSASFAILMIGLAALNTLLAVLLHKVAAAAATAPLARHEYLTRLAYLVGAVLIAALALTVIVLVHHLALRLFSHPEPFKPTPYEDAWTEAGKRLKPEDAPPVEPYENPSPDEDDEA